MSGNKKKVRAVALLFSLLFALAAIVQYNDPDPLIWILFYSVASITCILFYLNRFPATLGFVLGAIYLGAVIWVWPEQFEGLRIGSGDIQNIERGREALGLLIIAVVMFFLAWQARSRKS